MPQPKRDISREVQCPKCGYDPAHEELRLNVTYDFDNDRLIMGCIRCAHTWTEQPLDAEQPKVVK